MATQKNLVTFCDVHMVSSVWVFKRKWYGRSPIAEIEQDTRTLHGEIEALFSTGFGYDKPYERISRESLAGAVCRQVA